MAYLRLSDSAACEDAHVYHRESRASWSGHAPATESLDRAVMCWRWHSSTACSASTDAEASGVSGLPLWMMAASRMWTNALSPRQRDHHNASLGR